MTEFFPYPRQCLWLDQSRITSLQTRQNTDMGRDFTPVDVLALSDEDAIVALTKDMMVASPTPGFTAEFEARVFGHDMTFKVELKIDKLFATPRTSGGYLDSLGIVGEVYNERFQNWMTIHAMIRLGNRGDRWSFIHCYLLGKPPSES